MGVDPMSEFYVKAKSHTSARGLGDELIVLSARTSKIYGLNETGAAIWQAADGVTPLEQIARTVLAGTFEVSPEEAYSDALELARGLAAEGVLELSEAPIPERAA